MAHLDPKEFDAPADFPSIWLQRQRKEPKRDGAALGRQQHRHRPSATRAPPSAPAPRRPPSTAAHQARRGLDSRRAEPPAFSKFFPGRPTLAARGAPIYKEYCAACHGASGAISAALRGPGHAAGRDRHRPPPPRFLHLHAGGEPGHALRRLPVALHPVPQDPRLRQHAPGRHLAARALPAQRLGAQPARSARTGGRRPKVFWRGNDVFDPVKVGFVSDQPEAKGRGLFRLDTAEPGNGNGGHEGQGLRHRAERRRQAALVEFLKTF
jgi:hypothetical protein